MARSVQLCYCVKCATVKLAPTTEWPHAALYMPCDVCTMKRAATTFVAGGRAVQNAVTAHYLLTVAATVRDG